ncbi:MAG: YicC family protein [Flavobacteriales bacterium]|nr:YicC family protein [Flavobacteriales bacterium]
MIKSMTGYGKTLIDGEIRRFQVLMKSLNSKQLDVSLKMPDLFRDKELEIRSFLAEKFVRGKIDVRISYENIGGEKGKEIDREKVNSYYKELKEINEGLNNDSNVDYLSLILKMPDIMISKSHDFDENEWSKVREGIHSAAKELDAFRIMEGDVLEKDVVIRIDLIGKALVEIEKFEYKREEYIKDKIKQSLEELIEKDRIDENRLEQELIYYLQKIDITEEKVRLKSHLDYFINVLKSGNSEGKKLSFITQEMGREINTIGSKANDASMQKVIVEMKDELEKIKEQLLNIL